MIAKKYAGKTSVQSYGRKATIDGVRFIDVKRHIEDQGEFNELGRLTSSSTLEALPDFVVRQVNHSIMQPGAVKAWHLHERQDDLWFVPPDERLLVGLLDVRQGSASEGTSMRFILGDGQGRMLFIPRGVAHGAANPFRKPARILYFVNQSFDPQKPDELRLPYDIAGDSFWQMQKG